MQQDSKQSSTGFAKLHSKRVSWSKNSLFFILIALVAAVIIWPLTDYGSRGFKLTFKEIGATENKQPSMLKPRFHGKDKLNRPFNIIADKAIQLNEKEVELHNLDADITMQDGKKIFLSAISGKYNQNEKMLNLKKDIILISDEGYKIYTDKADIWVDAGTISGNLPITATGPMGRLYAKKFEVKNMGKIMRFYGGVTLRTLISD